MFVLFMSLLTQREHVILPCTQSDGHNPPIDRRWMCHVRYRGKIRAIWSTANATLPSERRMRLTSRDEGSGRGGGGKEEEGGVDELHFWGVWGLSWTINCLDCERIGGRWRAKKHGEEQKSCVISHRRSPRGESDGAISTEEKTTRQ